MPSGISVGSGGGGAALAPDAFPAAPQRCPRCPGLERGVKSTAGKSSIRFGDLPELDLSGVEQLVEHSQVRCISEAILAMGSGPMADGTATVEELLAQLTQLMDSHGLDGLRPGWKTGNLARPRTLEVAAALSRLRSLTVASTKKRARLQAGNGS